jgi:hypothetical protein
MSSERISKLSSFRLEFWWPVSRCQAESCRRVHLPGGFVPEGGPSSQPSARGSLEWFAQMLAQQANVLSTADTFLVPGARCVVYMFVLLVLPVRTYPPRILFAKR